MTRVRRGRGLGARFCLRCAVWKTTILSRKQRGRSTVRRCLNRAGCLAKSNALRRTDTKIYFWVIIFFLVFVFVSYFCFVFNPNGDGLYHCWAEKKYKEQCSLKFFDLTLIMPNEEDALGSRILLNFFSFSIQLFFSAEQINGFFSASPAN